MLARAAAIIVLGFVAYGSMLPAPFRLMDDRSSIIENTALKSAKNTLGIFQEGHYYYRPLIFVSFMGERQAFGLNSFFYNLDNLILHILNALLVFLLVSRLVNNGTIGFWAGLLFVIHPVQWEAVCIISGRPILLSAFFVLSGFILFLESYNHRRRYCLLLALIAFCMGLLCKESAGVFPFVVLAYLSTDKTRPWSQKIKYLWPFFIGIAGYLILRGYSGITALSQAGQSRDVILSFVTFLRSVITDLRLLVFPVDLHYDRCLPLFLSLRQPQAMAICSFWAAALGLFVLCYRKIPPFISFLILWFFIELLPVSQLAAGISVGVGRISTAEHFLYLACVPVLTGMVMFFRWCYEFNARGSVVISCLLKSLAGAFLAFLLLIAIEQSIYALSEFNMVARSLAFEPHDPRLLEDMGLLNIFRKDIPGAEVYFRAATRAEPTNAQYHIRLGTVLCQEGRWIEGLAQFVVFDPGEDRVLVQRQEKLTMEHIRQQLSQGKTYDARGWLAIGIYYERANQDQEAIDAFLKCVSINPEQTDAWFNLGSLYEARQDRPAARAAYQKLLGLPGLTSFQKDFAVKHLNTLEKR